MTMVKYAIDQQEGCNWMILPSTSEEREAVRANQRSKYAAVKTCLLCKQPFDYGYASMHVCGACKVMVKCAVCGKEFQLNFSNFSGSDRAKINNALLNGEDVVAFCSKACKAVQVGKSNIAWHRKHPGAKAEERQKNTMMKWCDVCNAETQHYGDDCLRCHGKNAVQKMMQHAKDHPEMEEEHRKNCAKALAKYYEEHPGERRRIAVQNITGWNQSAGGYLFLKQHGEELGKQYGGANKALKENDGGVLMWHDSVTGEDVPWDEYRKHFEQNLVPLEWFKNWLVIPTFRAPNSTTLAGAKQPFEQLLVNLNIRWFVYIKMYEGHDGLLRPLVVGKSGSTLVNVGGSDVNFSTDVDDGPARRYLKDGGFNWCFGQILVLPVNDEEEAYRVEHEVTLQTHLFQS